MSAPLRREDLISRRSAAKHLGIHVNTFDRWAAEAGLKKYKIRGDQALYFARAEVVATWTEIVEVSA